jgi:hypothetical protein
MLTLLRSRFRLIAVPVAAGGALVALAIGVGAAPSIPLASASAASPTKCQAKVSPGIAHPACVGTKQMQARANAVKVPKMKSPTTVRLPQTKPPQSTGTAGDRARWAQIQAALSAKAA